MNLRLALVTATRQADCTLRWLESSQELLASYSPAVQGRIKLRPRQLVAVDTTTALPTVMWRWFRGVIVFQRDDHVVVDNHIYQQGFRAPISVVRLPDVLEVAVGLGDEVFHSLGTDGVVIDTAQGDGPAHPGRLATDLFPAIADFYTELHERGEA
jgi:hypothetical protein